MTLIKASCPVCGEVDLTPRDVTLNVSVRTPERSHYAFTCPTCTDRVEKHADDHVIALLHSGGVVNKTAWEPSVNPEPKTDGPELTWDDLLAFTKALYLEDDVCRWAR